MNFDISSIFKKIEPIKRLFKKYATALIIVIVTIIFGYLVFQISNFNNQEPTEDDISEKIKTLQRPRIDKEIVEKLENLEQDNIKVQTLFNEARDNPFTE